MAVVLPPVVDLADGAEQVRQDPEGFLARCRDQYGSVFTVVMAEGKRITYVLDPHVFQPLLTARQVDFSSISRQSKLRFGLGGMVETEADVRQLSTGLIRALRGRPHPHSNPPNHHRPTHQARHTALKRGRAPHHPELFQHGVRARIERH